MKVPSAIEQQLREIQKKLTCWTDFVQEAKIPANLAPVMLTGRTELLKAVKAKDLPADQVQLLYDLIGVLLETNQALKNHASLLAELVAQTDSHLTGLARQLHRIESYANFQNSGEEDDA